MFGFILGLVAGFLTPHAEGPVAQPLAKAMAGHLRLEPGEMRVLSFILVMLIAGIGAELLNSGSTFWVILGGGLGYFATRLVAAARAAYASRSR
jgi:hypothetical protein